jgi:hypothetical protein
MLALKRSHLNRYYILIKVLKDLATVSMYTQIFYMINKGDIPSIQCKMTLRGPKSIRKVNGLILIFSRPGVLAIRVLFKKFRIYFL